MIRNNKVKLIIASIVTLLPIAAGLLLWDSLPEVMATHWGADGTADGHSSKLFTVLVLPLILLAFHWLCVIVTALDPKNKEINRKLFNIVIWICPILSILVSSFTYMFGLGLDFDVSKIIIAFMGVLFFIIGNYLPKVRRNYTIGIKIPWTLDSDENWNATHRLAGKIWVIGGIVMIPCVMLQYSVGFAAMFIILAVMIIIPIVYSYIISRR